MSLRDGAAWRPAAIHSIETECHTFDCASLHRLIRMPLVQPRRIPLTCASGPSSPSGCHQPSQLEKLLTFYCLVNRSRSNIRHILLLITKGVSHSCYSNSSCLPLFCFASTSSLALPCLTRLVVMWSAVACLLQVPDNWDQAATRSCAGSVCLMCRGSRTTNQPNNP